MIRVKKWVVVTCLLVASGIGYGIGVGAQRDADRTQEGLRTQLHRTQSLLSDCVTGPKGERKTLPPLQCMYEDC